MTSLVVLAFWLGGAGIEGLPTAAAHSLHGQVTAEPPYRPPPGMRARDQAAGLHEALHAHPAPLRSPGDRWLGADKARHFFLSFGGTSLAFGAARTAGLGREDGLRLAAGLGIAAGVWKELRDASREGETASLKDLAWDLAGVAAAVGLASATR